MILVSACLLGKDCKYNSANNRNQAVIDYLADKEYIPVCPECYGGLPTPRPPSEICGGDGSDVLAGKAKVLSADGKDVTDEFIAGAQKLLELAQQYEEPIAVLKEKSPSCGLHFIYDGSFSGKVAHGSGVATALLQKNGIQVLSEKEIEG